MAKQALLLAAAAWEKPTQHQLCDVMLIEAEYARTRTPCTSMKLLLFDSLHMARSGCAGTRVPSPCTGVIAAPAAGKRRVTRFGRVSTQGRGELHVEQSFLQSLLLSPERSSRHKQPREDKHATASHCSCSVVAASEPMLPAPSPTRNTSPPNSPTQATMHEASSYARSAILAGALLQSWQQESQPAALQQWSCHAACPILRSGPSCAVHKHNAANPQRRIP